MASKTEERLADIKEGCASVFFVYFVVVNPQSHAVCRAVRLYGKKWIWYNIPRKDNSHGDKMQTLRFDELRARMPVRSKPDSRAPWRREALRT